MRRADLISACRKTLADARSSKALTQNALAFAPTLEREAELIACVKAECDAEWWLEIAEAAGAETDQYRGVEALMSRPPRVIGGVG